MDPLTLISDRDKTSPYNISTKPSRLVVSMKKNISLGIISWSFMSNELFHCFFHDDVRLSLGYNTILEFILHVTNVVTICTLTFLDEYKPLYHPEEIGDLYALFHLIVTELRTEGFNLAFQFENIDFLRNVLRVYDSYTWFRCFHEDRYRRTEYYWLTTTFLLVGKTVTIFTF